MNFVKRDMVLIGCILIVFLSSLLMMGGVKAIGISGDNLNVMMNFEPGMERQFTYDVLVTNPDVENYEAFSVDELSGYIRIEPRYLKFNKEQQNHLSFSAFLKLPDNEKDIGPGKHCAGVGANEMAGGENSTGMSISTRTSAKAWVCVKVLYPGKYVEGALNIPNGNEGEIIHPSIEITSGGKDDINSVSAEIIIYDLNGTEIKRMSTDNAPLPSEGKVEFKTSFETVGMKPGNYRADAIIHYDGSSAETGETRFMIGALNVVILDYTKQMYQGKINKMDIKVESQWNSPIEGVYARVLIGNQDVKSLPISIESWTEGTISAYIDANSFELGTMPVKIMVFYAETKTVMDGVVEIVKDPNAGKFEWFKNLNMTIALIIILIIIIEVVWILKKKVDDGSKKKKDTEKNK